jgi:hypothetical protein
MRDPPGWRSYERAARVRHANSDNGGPTIPQPPIEPQGQSLALPKPAVDRDPAEGVSNDALRLWMGYDMSWASLLAEQQGQAPVKPAFPPHRKIRGGVTWGDPNADAQAAGQGDPLPPPANL